LGLKSLSNGFTVIQLMGLNHYLVVSNGVQPTITLTNEWFSSDIVGFDEDLMGCNFEITNQLDMIFGLGVS